MHHSCVAMVMDTLPLQSLAGLISKKKRHNHNVSLPYMLLLKLEFRVSIFWLYCKGLFSSIALLLSHLKRYVVLFSPTLGHVNWNHLLEILITLHMYLVTSYEWLRSKKYRKFSIFEQWSSLGNITVGVTSQIFSTSLYLLLLSFHTCCDVQSS